MVTPRAFSALYPRKAGGTEFVVYMGVTLPKLNCLAFLFIEGYFPF